MTTETRKPSRTIALAVIAVGVIVAVVLATRPLAQDAAPELAEGAVVEVDDGLVYFLWDGGKERIQQPVAYSDADLDELDLTVGDDAPELLTVGDEGSYFAVYPFDGPQAKLYLVDGDTMHAVRVSKAGADQLADRPDLSELVITRVRIPASKGG